MKTNDVYEFYKCTYATPESPIHEGNETDPLEMMEVFVNTAPNSTKVLSFSFHQLPSGKLTYVSIDRKSPNGEWSTLAIFEKDGDMQC